MAEHVDQQSKGSFIVDDKDVLQDTDSKEVTITLKEFSEFADISKYSRTKCYVKTKFHKSFYHKLTQIHSYGDIFTYIVGIEGIGKTSSLINFVIDCKRRNNDRIHYIDLNRIEKVDKDLNKFSGLVKDLKNIECLVIDHVTLCNNHLVESIKDILKNEIVQYIIVETGFTASARKSSLDFGKSFQLDEEDFSKLWHATLTSVSCNLTESNLQDLHMSGRDVYDTFSKRFMMTPRLLHFIIIEMSIFERTVDEAYDSYLNNLRLEISKISDIGEDQLFSKYHECTRLLLYHIPDNCDQIFTAEQIKQFYIAINIFEIEHCRVKTDDLINDTRFTDLLLEVGQTYYRITHLVPILGDYYRARLPYNVDRILAHPESGRLLNILFQSGHAQKEFDKLLVDFQIKYKMTILPQNSRATVYHECNSRCVLNQTERWAFAVQPDCLFLTPKCDDLFSFKTSHQGPKLNVARCALLIKEQITKKGNDVLFLFPDLQNLMGVDYFFYEPAAISDPTPKKGRYQDTLYLFQVATGSKHTGHTIGQTLEVFQDIFSDMDQLMIHVVVIIARPEKLTYTLTQCQFENISVINLNHKASDIMSQDGYLHAFLNHLIQ